MCPTCGKPMVRRTAQRGSKAGDKFWGCSTFPVCRGTRAA
jgi:restriction system protein